MDWQAIGLDSDPFRVVPPTGPTSSWFGRPALKARLESIARSWTDTSPSSLYLVWADLGAGKTHALRYIEHLVSKVDPPASAVYADLTQAPDSFVDIFERVVRHIPESVLVESIKGFRQQRGAQWLDAPELGGDRQTPQALRILAEASDSDAAETVRAWLRSESITRLQGQAAGGIVTIRDADGAVRVLVSLIQVILGGRYSRFVLMLDEYQRLGQVSKRRMDDINAAMKAVYDRCPQGLTIFLTYSFGKAEHINYMTSADLRDRVESRLQLPALTPAEGTGFLSELIGAHSAKPNSVFTPSGIKALAAGISKVSADKMTPRRLMQTAKAVVLAGVEQSATFPLTAEVTRRLMVSTDADSP